MLKNTAGQKIALYAEDYSTGAPKTGDAANLTFYVNKDWGGINALGDTSELSSTNAAGWYICDLTQAETNADTLHFTGKSSTGNVRVVGNLMATDAIKAKTDNLPPDPADASDIAALFSTVNSTLSTIAGYIDTEVAAIKAKTDLIPASPAAVSDIPTTAQIADKWTGRNIEGGSDGGRTNGEAMAGIRNKKVVAAGVMTVYDKTDSSPVWTAVIATSPGNPITSIDPA